MIITYKALDTDIVSKNLVAITANDCCNKYKLNITTTIQKLISVLAFSFQYNIKMLLSIV